MFKLKFANYTILVSMLPSFMLLKCHNPKHLKYFSLKLESVVTSHSSLSESTTINTPSFVISPATMCINKALGCFHLAALRHGQNDFARGHRYS